MNSRKAWLMAVFIMVFSSTAYADVWRITAYDACEKCCGKKENHPAYGITASGKKAIVGYVACNWLPFGTKVEIEGMGVYLVQDRGAKSLFGSKTNRIKHLDVYFETHKEARKFGNQYREVTIIK